MAMTRCTFFDNPSGKRASTSPLESRIASRVLATYVGTVRPHLTFSSLGSPPFSEPTYSDKMSGSPVSAKYNRKPSAPTAVNVCLTRKKRKYLKFYNLNL